MTEYCDVGPSVCRANTCRARNTYKCCECKVSILPAEEYVYCFGVWEGEPNTYHQHLLCAEACEYFRDYINDGDCLPFGSLLEEAREYWRMFDTSHKGDPEIVTWREMLAKILRRKRTEK